MKDEEYEVLDELYFVQRFDFLKSELSFSEAVLKNILQSLYAKGWIKILADIDTEASKDQIAQIEFNNFFFLATKSGLLAHNT